MKKLCKTYIPLGMCLSVERNDTSGNLHPVRDASLTGCRRGTLWHILLPRDTFLTECRNQYSISILTLLFFCVSAFCFNSAAQPVFSKKETLYSTKNGSAIGNLLLSIEPKSGSANNNEWILTIGDRGNNFFESRSERTLWIFNKRVTANDFRREMRSRDYAVEVKDINDFSIFCENGIRFELKEWEELRRQTQVSFFINASTGQQVTLRLVFYASSQDRRRTTIDDEAKVRIDFVVPDPSARASTSTSAAGSAPAPEGELISLTERIDPATAAQLRKQKEEEDALLQSETANRGERTVLLNSFITDRNRDILLLQEEVNELLADKKTKVEGFKIDSLVTIAEEMKKRVDFWETGYADILLTEEAIHDKFTRFRLAHTATSKKIDELKQQQLPFSEVWDFIKNNILLSLGIGIGGIFFLKFFMKMLKRLTSMIKGAIKSKINKMKSDAKNKVKQQPKKWLKKQKKNEKKFDDEFENIDINDLAEI